MDIRPGPGQYGPGGGVELGGADGQGGAALAVHGVHLGPQGNEESRQDGIALFRGYVEGSPVLAVPGVHIHLSQEVGPGPFGFPLFQKGPYVILRGLFRLGSRACGTAAQDKGASADKKKQGKGMLIPHTLIIGKYKDDNYRPAADPPEHT